MNRVVKFMQAPGDPPIDRVIRPFQRFAAEEASGGIVLLTCTIIALVWANVDFRSYQVVWDSHLIIGLPNFQLNEPLHFWINDALMAIFFFVVGLEIKREVLAGELSSLRNATLPIAAAVGGMVVPALVYFAINGSGEGARGWGVPMATDIAFSLGVLAVLGSRVPLSLKLFLTAFAIVDDIGAVAVIAVFYTESISGTSLAVGGGLIGVLFILNLMGVRNPLVYALIGLVVWVAFLTSGIHATVAGVAVAATIPIRVRIDAKEFVRKGRELLHEFEHDVPEIDSKGPFVLTTEDQRAALEELEIASKEVESPLQRLEHSLHPWVAFGIIPLFALSNAGVAINEKLFNIITQPIALGIILGLVVGKPLGITLLSWLAVKIGWANLPEGITWRQVAGVAMLGGIGFTMSIFIADLAFLSEEFVADAKVGILLASVIAGLVGYFWLRHSTVSSGESAQASTHTEPGI